MSDLISSFYLSKKIMEDASKYQNTLVKKVKINGSIKKYTNDKNSYNKCKLCEQCGQYIYVCICNPIK